MTQDELVNLGKVLAALQRVEYNQKKLLKTMEHMSTEVMKHGVALRRLACVTDDDPNEPDTDPECPVANQLSEPPSHRKSLHSVSEDEPDSIVTRPVSVHAGSLSIRGPGLMIALVLILGAPSIIGVLFLTHKFLGVP